MFLNMKYNIENAQDIYLLWGGGVGRCVSEI